MKPYLIFSDQLNFTYVAHGLHKIAKMAIYGHYYCGDFWEPIFIDCFDFG